MLKGSGNMQLYPHHTVETDKIKAKNLFHSEKTLLQMYDNVLIRQKEGTIKSDVYTLLKDEKNILNDFENKIAVLGWK